MYYFDGTLDKNGPTIGRKEHLQLKSGDQGLFTLNLRKKQICLKKNNDKEEILFDNIPIGGDIRYKIAVSLYSFYASLSVSLDRIV